MTVALVVPAAVLLGACGGGGSAQASEAANLSRSCQAVAAVLSDGPSPTRDPLGYAEAQVLPLGHVLSHVRTSDGALRNAVRRLERAYRVFEASNGSAAAKAAVRTASRRLNRICPGAAP